MKYNMLFGIMLFFISTIYAKTVTIDMYVANESWAKVGSQLSLQI